MEDVGDHPQHAESGDPRSMPYNPYNHPCPGTILLLVPSAGTRAELPWLWKSILRWDEDVVTVDPYMRNPE